MRNLTVCTLTNNTTPTINVLHNVSSIRTQFNGFAISAAPNLVSSKQLSFVLVSCHHHVPSCCTEQGLQTVSGEIHHLFSPTNQSIDHRSYLPFFKCNSKSSPASEFSDGLMSITSSDHSHLFVTPRWPVSIVMMPLGDNAIILDKFPLNL